MDKAVKRYLMGKDQVEPRTALRSCTHKTVKVTVKKHLFLVDLYVGYVVYLDMPNSTRNTERVEKLCIPLCQKEL